MIEGQKEDFKQPSSELVIVLSHSVRAARKLSIF